MWTFIQRSGVFLNPDGSRLTVGYSGNWDGVPPPGGPNDHRNKPEDQSIKNKGPIPVGRYTIGPAYNDPGGKGPVVMPLTFDPANQMFGRDGFLIHGDRSPPRSGTASDGCIILDRGSRDTISGSDDRTLLVVSDGAGGAVAAGLFAAAVPVAKGTAKKVAKKAARKAVKKPAKKPATRKSVAQKKAAGTKAKSAGVARRASGHAAKKTMPRPAAAKKAARRSRR